MGARAGCLPSKTQQCVRRIGTERGKDTVVGPLLPPLPPRHPRYPPRQPLNLWRCDNVDAAFCMLDCCRIHSRFPRDRERLVAIRPPARVLPHTLPFLVARFRTCIYACTHVCGEDIYSIDFSPSPTTTRKPPSRPTISLAPVREYLPPARNLLPARDSLAGFIACVAASDYAFRQSRRCRPRAVLRCLVSRSRCCSSSPPLSSITELHG